MKKVETIQQLQNNPQIQSLRQQLSEQHQQNLNTITKVQLLDEKVKTLQTETAQYNEYIIEIENEWANFQHRRQLTQNNLSLVKETLLEEVKEISQIVNSQKSEKFQEIFIDADQNARREKQELESRIKELKQAITELRQDKEQLEFITREQDLRINDLKQRQERIQSLLNLLSGHNQKKLNSEPSLAFDRTFNQNESEEETYRIRAIINQHQLD